MRIVKQVILISAVVIMAACEQGAVSGPFAVATRRPIINGSPPNSEMHDAVVSLHQMSRRYVTTSFCSGTLITDNVVLTAAHCLDEAKSGKPNFTTIDPAKLVIYVGDGPLTQEGVSDLIPVTETLIHPDYNRFALLNDIALIRLATPVPASQAQPVPSLPASVGFANADIGMTLNFAGFGVDENDHSGVKLQVDGILEGLGCSVSGCGSPGDADTQISYTQPNSGPCFGDSGGPAFLDRDGVKYVGGVTSYGDSECAVYGVSTRVDAFDAWIADFINGTPEPVCEADGNCNPDCAPGADPDCDSTPESCGNGVCDANESCDGRSGTAACALDCPGKMNGKPSGRFCYVGGVCEGSGC